MSEARPDDRVCVICGTDISHRRRDAECCGSGCRAEKTRLEKAGLPLPHASGHREPERPRARRAGVEIYLTDAEQDALVESPNGSEILARVAEKIRTAQDRKRDRALV